MSNVRSSNSSLISTSSKGSTQKNIKIKYNAAKTSKGVSSNAINNTKQIIKNDFKKSETKDNNNNSEKTSNDMNMTDGKGEKASLSQRPDHFYQSAQSNFDYVPDQESPTTCLLMPSPVSMTTKFNANPLSFSDFNYNRSKSQDKMSLAPGNAFNTESDENAVFISSYEDILLAKKYQKQNHQGSIFPTMVAAWPHFITGVLASILVISLLSLTLSSFCLYKMILLSEYNLDEINRTVANLRSVPYQVEETDGVVDSNHYDSFTNASALSRSKENRKSQCKTVQQKGKQMTEWIPNLHLLKEWSVSGVVCSLRGFHVVKLETNQKKTQHRCVCQPNEDQPDGDKEAGEKYCLIDFMICRK